MSWRCVAFAAMRSYMRDAVDNPTRGDPSPVA